MSPIDSGETVRSVGLPSEGQLLVGRSADADWPVPDLSVSRRHATIVRSDETWLLTDLNSRHGTSVNDRRIEPGSPTPIQDGDVIAFGSWRCRCTSGTDRPGGTTPFTPLPAEAASVSAIPAQQLGGVAQRGLDVLMELTGKLHSLADRGAVASAAVDALQRATACRRIVIVEPTAEQELVVLASSSGETPSISRTLIEQAARQGLVELRVSGSTEKRAPSIVDLGIRSAICAPILIEDSPSAYITIDTRDAEGVVPQDAAAFCNSVAQLVALSFDRIAAESMAERHRELRYDLDAARRVQELLSPPSRGSLGPVSYHFESIPGRVVAGDLFDIFPIDRSRVAFFLGDVSGKGVGAAMLMAACQSQLRTQLLSGAGLPAAMVSVNADIHQRSEASKFITMVCGVVDAQPQTIEIVDAGHGLCALTSPGGAPERVETAPGFPLGVLETAEYEVTSLAITPGCSLVVFSDGAVEQTDPDGNQYGIDRVLDSLRPAAEDGRFVERLIEDIRQHARGPLADDLTVARVSPE